MANAIGLGLVWGQTVKGECWLWAGKEEGNEIMKREDQVPECFFLFMYLFVFYLIFSQMYLSSLNVLAVFTGSSATVWSFIVIFFDVQFPIYSTVFPFLLFLILSLWWKTDTINIYFSLLFYSLNTISNSSFVLYKPRNKLDECSLY